MVPFWVLLKIISNESWRHKKGRNKIKWTLKIRNLYFYIKILSLMEGLHATISITIYKFSKVSLFKDSEDNPNAAF